MNVGRSPYWRPGRRFCTASSPPSSSVFGASHHGSCISFSSCSLDKSCWANSLVGSSNTLINFDRSAGVSIAHSSSDDVDSVDHLPQNEYNKNIEVANQGWHHPAALPGSRRRLLPLLAKVDSLMLPLQSFLVIPSFAVVLLKIWKVLSEYLFRSLSYKSPLNTDCEPLNNLERSSGSSTYIAMAWRGARTWDLKQVREQYGTLQVGQVYFANCLRHLFEVSIQLKVRMLNRNVQTTRYCVCPWVFFFWWYMYRWLRSHFRNTIWRQQQSWELELYKLDCCEHQVSTASKLQVSIAQLVPLTNLPRWMSRAATTWLSHAPSMRERRIAPCSFIHPWQL